MSIWQQSQAHHFCDTHMHTVQFRDPPPHGATVTYFLKSTLVAPHGGGTRNYFFVSHTFWLDVSFCFQWHQDLLFAWGWVFSTRVLDLALLPHPNHRGCYLRLEVRMAKETPKGRVKVYVVVYLCLRGRLLWSIRECYGRRTSHAYVVKVMTYNL
jgi:hypothetical protein